MNPTVALCTPAETKDARVIDWAAIVEQHGPNVWRTVYRLLSDFDDASDCYQDTFLAALEYHRKQPVRNWGGVLKTIATARALDRLRKRYRKRTAPLDDAVEAATADPSPDEAAQLREAIGQLREALTRLPDRYAEVFWLSQIEQVSHGEIAVQLETTTESVALWLHRGKRKLRELLAEKDVDSEVRQ